ncbi:MAG: patatin-like phospholipase family protein [Synergistaceae bacterium]|jgi:NTE family protein|nr:patatin-like phospholipase family protein [Synergistaceae bacterium]
MKKIACILMVLSIVSWGSGLAGGSEMDLAMLSPHSPSGANKLSADGRGGVVLALSGGGTKGFAHVGILKVLEREKIPVVGIAGTSIGAVIGGLYACGYTADEIGEIIYETNIMGLLADSGTRVKTDAGDHRPVGENVKVYRLNFDKNVHLKGPLGVLPALSLVSFLTKYTGHLQATDFMDLPIPFACIATDLGSGSEVVLTKGNLASAIRASASIPGLLEPWPIDGRLLVDGGLVDNLPVLAAKELFPGYPVIGVNLAGESIVKPNERFKSLMDVLTQTIDIMTIDRIKMSEAAADLMIYPDVTMYGMLDSSGYKEIYKRGMNAAESRLDRILELSAASVPPSGDHKKKSPVRIVRNVRIEGLHATLASELENRYKKWVGQPYDVNAVNEAIEKMEKLDEVAAVDVDTHSTENGAPTDVDVVFSAEKRPPFELGIGGYVSSLHSRRWISLSANARDLSSNGDAANINTRYGNEEWGVDARYFTPLTVGGQWGFSLSGGKNHFEPDGFDSYSVEKYSARILYYRERMDDFRFGIGLAGEYARAPGYDGFSWGPYLYFNRDTLDNLLTPSRGYSFNSRIWLGGGGDDIFSSRTTLTAYIPWKSDLRFMLNFGLATGERNNAAYSVLLGSMEELYSLARTQLVSDQAMWARVGLSRDFHNSWWGAVRGEVFVAYGASMEDWNTSRDVWEVGLALSFPGQLLSGKIVLVYSNDDDVVFGFSLGDPRWRGGNLP